MAVVLAEEGSPKRGSRSRDAKRAKDPLRSSRAKPILRAVFRSWRTNVASALKWRRMQIEEPPDELPVPKLRTPSKHHAPENRRGVSPPPMCSEGWFEMKDGWQWH